MTLRTTSSLDREEEGEERKERGRNAGRPEERRGGLWERMEGR